MISLDRFLRPHVVGQETPGFSERIIKSYTPVKALFAIDDKFYVADTKDRDVLLLCESVGPRTAEQCEPDLIVGGLRNGGGFWIRPDLRRRGLGTTLVLTLFHALGEEGWCDQKGRRVYTREGYAVHLAAYRVLARESMGRRDLPP